MWTLLDLMNLYLALKLSASVSLTAKEQGVLNCRSTSLAFSTILHPSILRGKEGPAPGIRSGPEPCPVLRPCFRPGPSSWCPHTPHRALASLWTCLGRALTGRKSGAGSRHGTGPGSGSLGLWRPPGPAHCVIQSRQPISLSEPQFLSL